MSFRSLARRIFFTRKSSSHSSTSQVVESLQDETFVSLVLCGPKSNNNNDTITVDTLRGCIKQVQGRRIQLKGRELLQVTFKYHAATDIAKNWPLDNSKQQQQQQQYHQRGTLGYCGFKPAW
jgi:hypothetical protein